MSSQVIIALGGNLGDVQACGKTALARLGAIHGIDVEQVSRWYSTAPVGCDGRFLNAAARLRSDVDPEELLQQMQVIETELGRRRTGHWTPRPIDLDLVLFGNRQIRSPHLHVPHPSAWYRRFVLDPACEVSGTLCHPDFDQTLLDLRDRLRRRPLPVKWQVGWPVDELLSPELQERYTKVVDWQASAQEAVVEFCGPESVAPGSRRIGLLDDIQIARQVVIDTLTAILDEPKVVDP